MEEAVAQSMHSRLWFVPVKINDRAARPHYALVDSGCSTTCINQSTWLEMKRHRNEHFENVRGSIRGVGGETAASIQGSALIRLYMMDDADEVIEITARALIVKNLDGPLFIGQDILGDSRIMESMSTKAMTLRSMKGRHVIPFNTGGGENLVEVCNSLIPKRMLELSLMRTECLQPGERKLVDVESKSFV